MLFIYFSYLIARARIFTSMHLAFGKSWASLVAQTIKESESEVTQSCPTLCDPMDCSLPGSSLHEILQARVLEWVAISFFRGSSRPRDRTQVSRIPGRCFNLWATRTIKKSAWNVGDLGSIPGLGRFLGEGDGYPLQLFFFFNICLFNLFILLCQALVVPWGI